MELLPFQRKAIVKKVTIVLKPQHTMRAPFWRDMPEWMLWGKRQRSLRHVSSKRGFHSVLWLYHHLVGPSSLFSTLVIVISKANFNFKCKQGRGVVTVTCLSYAENPEVLLWNKLNKAIIRLKSGSSKKLPTGVISLSMSFYPYFTLILARLIPDFIQILSDCYSNFIPLLKKSG